jgi:MFS superfamily sulfate permease-like transporter
MVEQSLRRRLAAHIRGRVPDSPWDVVPGLADLREYRREQLRTDAIAGISIAAVAVPAGLGMGELAGLTAVAGLYATLLPLAAYSLFGSSRQLVVGPESALAILTAATIAPFAAGDPARSRPSRRCSGSSSAGSSWCHLFSGSASWPISSESRC